MHERPSLHQERWLEAAELSMVLLRTMSATPHQLSPLVVYYSIKSSY